MIGKFLAVNPAGVEHIDISLDPINCSTIKNVKQHHCQSSDHGKKKEPDGAKTCQLLKSDLLDFLPLLSEEISVIVFQVVLQQYSIRIPLKAITLLFCLFCFWVGGG